MTFPDPVNLTGFIDMAQYANTVTDNVFVIMLLLSAYLIPLIYLLMRLSPEKWASAALSAGFFVTITAIFLRVAEILTVDWYIYICVASVVLPLIYVYLKDTST